MAPATTRPRKHVQTPMGCEGHFTRQQAAEALGFASEFKIREFERKGLLRSVRGPMRAAFYPRAEVLALKAQLALSEPGRGSPDAWSDAELLALLGHPSAAAMRARRSTWFSKPKSASSAPSACTTSGSAVSPCRDLRRPRKSNRAPSVAALSAPSEPVRQARAQRRRTALPRYPDPQPARSRSAHSQTSLRPAQGDRKGLAPRPSRPPPSAPPSVPSPT